MARGVPRGMESEPPSSPLHANVMCLEMSCQAEPCAFPWAHLPWSRKDQLLRAVPASVTAAFLGVEGSSRDTIYTLKYIYTHIHALVLRGKHCMIVIEIMLR